MLIMDRRPAFLLLWFLAAAGAPPDGAVAAEPPRIPQPADPQGIEFFEKHVRPILVQSCYECHGEKKSNGGLRLDSREGWTAGGDSGPAIVPGKPDESLLIQAIRYGGDYEMPPKGKLPAEVIANLERWVAMGAPDPRAGAAAQPVAGLDLEKGREHWSYRPLVNHPLPKVGHEDWPQAPLDHFILAQLEREQIAPAAEADRATLIRRVYFDLWGLPPTPEEIDAFVRDPAADAYPRLVDRLLGSPRFGERWGRHWLDIARYAESLTLRGFVFKEAWRYRDYVIATFNEDRPYDVFLREQIAGDLLPAATRGDRERQLVATTYLALGNTNLEEQDKKQLEMDVIDEQLDVITKGILAQTVTCARCHDHKFDPIPQRDYYALAGILRNTKALEHDNVSKWVETELPVEPEQELVYQRHRSEVAAIQTQLDAAKKLVKKASTQSSAASPALVLQPSQLPGVVVDDRQAKRVGDWKESQFTKRYIGEGYLHDLNEGKGEKTLTFAPELPKDGKYEVRFAYSSAQGRATSVELTVFSADGEKTVLVDETEPPPIDGRFVSLGQFRFERAGQSFVIVATAGASGHVTADAVQFLPVELVEATLKAATADSGRAADAEAASLTKAEAELKRLEAELKKLTTNAPYRPMAMTVVEKSEIRDGHIQIRGVVHHPGEQVPRGFLQVCSVDPLPAIPKDQSGRVQLAEWLTHPTNPLPARVLANRLWHALFGAGLVRTVDNFGTTGELPSHPELLDYLANQLIERDWSVKEVLREMVLSRTYRQASTGSPATQARAMAADPENRWWWRMNRRRLDAECLRDAILASSDQLDLAVGGQLFPSQLAADYGFQHTSRRRSVYVPVFRNSLPEIFEAFDFADPSLVTGRRSASTVAPQALFFMNHPFVIEQSRSTADRMLALAGGDAGQGVDLAFRTLLGRPPSAREREAAVQFLTVAESAAASAERSSESSAARRTAWAQFCQSLFASIDFRYLD